MKANVNLSVFQSYDQDNIFIGDLLKRAGFNFDCSLQLLQWDVEWEKMLAWAVHKKDTPDISQLGSPLVGDLIGMNALRPFTENELRRIGGRDIFYDVSWKSSARVFNGQVFAIPFFCDTCVIVYWRDMLEKAGLDEQVAFQTAQDVENTLRTLQSTVTFAPLVHATRNKLNEVRHAASWIWGAGGDFVSSDHRTTTFNDAEARVGLKAYLRLNQYMPKSPGLMESTEAFDLFKKRQAAVIFTNSIPMINAILQDASPEIASLLGVSLPPGPALVGDSDLVVWQSGYHFSETLEMIMYLTSQTVQAEYCRVMQVLPARKDVLSQPAFSNFPFTGIFEKALLTGRSFPVLPQAGLLENRLSNVMQNIWLDLTNSPDQDLDALMTRTLEPSARMLDNLLREFRH